MEKINYKDFEGCIECGDLECKCETEPKEILKPRKEELKQISGMAEVGKIGYMLTPSGVRLVEVVEMVSMGFRYYYLYSDMTRHYSGYMQGRGTWFHKLQENQKDRDLFELCTGPETRPETKKIPLKINILTAIEGLEIANKKLNENNLEYFKNKILATVLNHFKDENIKEIEIKTYRNLSSNLTIENIKEYKENIQKTKVNKGKQR